MTWTGFDGKDGWSPDDVAGAGPLESLVQTVDSFSRLEEGDVTELGLNAAALSLDLLGMAMDPSRIAGDSGHRLADRASQLPACTAGSSSRQW